MGLAIRNVLARRTTGAKGEELRLPLPETAIEFLMAACAHAAEMDVQSVEMVGMRLSTPSLDRFRFSWPSCELGGERSSAGWDDDDSEGLRAGDW